MQTIETAANKDRAFWAHMRQNISLFNRGDYKHDSRLKDAVNRELADILDSRIITYPPTMLKLGIDGYMTLQQRKAALGVSTDRPMYSENEHRLLKLLKQKAENGRKANWQWRIAEEAEEKQRLGWYPFFITLTVDPNHARFGADHPRHRKGVTDPESLWKDGREFRLFIRCLVNVVCEQLGHPPAHKKTANFGYRPESDYVTYAAVIEHGKSREHHHCHMLVWMREIPSKWKQCPNRQVVNPEKRIFNDCPSMRYAWKWSLPGLSKFNYYRTIGDVWSSKHAFRTPVKSETGQPIRIAPAKAAGRYITKYIQKDHKEWHHRVKATRNLGMKKLKQTISQLDPAVIGQLTHRPKTSNLLHSLSLIHSAPLGLVRLIAKQQHYLNLYKLNSLDLKKHLKPSSDAFMQMLRSARAGHRPDRMHSLAFFDWVNQFLPEESEYCEERLVEAHRKLSREFPRNTYKVEKHITIGGNNIGSALSV